jgi:hypothetical protein
VAQFCAFTDHGMVVQSLMTFHGDLDWVGGTKLRAARWLVNFTCSFDRGECMQSTLWLDQLDPQGQYQRLFTLVTEPEPRKPRVASHTGTFVTIDDGEDTWLLDRAEHKFSYVHRNGAGRGEGACIDRKPPLFELMGIGDWR